SRDGLRSRPVTGRDLNPSREGGMPAQTGNYHVEITLADLAVIVDVQDHRAQEEGGREGGGDRVTGAGEGAGTVGSEGDHVGRVDDRLTFAAIVFGLGREDVHAEHDHLLHGLI